MLPYMAIWLQLQILKSFVPHVDVLILFLQAGKIIITFKEHRSRVVRWAVWGVITVSCTYVEEEEATYSCLFQQSDYDDFFVFRV